MRERDESRVWERERKRKERRKRKTELKEEENFPKAATTTQR